MSNRSANPTRSAPVPSKPEPVRVPVHFDRRAIDRDALNVVRRLVRHGYEAYLVGGGVRDLLLGFHPKDFDVATNARPEQVRRLFRNSRIIGRRFRLVHVMFRDKLIEVATFRRAPASKKAPDDNEMLIVQDNEYGEAHEDAIRRDLTVNGLLYDVQTGEVLDFVDGMPDIRSRVVRTIGDPNVRFREDPARMLRAIKFTARLDMGMAPSVYDAIVLHRQRLRELSRPRLLEEVLKLMRSGASRRCMWLAWETGLLSVMLPELAMFLDDESGSWRWGRFWESLVAVDKQTLVSGPRRDEVLLTLLLLEPLRLETLPTPSRAAQAREALLPVIDRLAIPRRYTDTISRVVGAELRLARGKVGRFARSAAYPIACEVFDISPPREDELTGPQRANKGKGNKK